MINITMISTASQPITVEMFAALYSFAKIQNKNISGGASGLIETINYLDPGGAGDGPYNDVPATGGTGTGATFNINMEGGMITFVMVNNPGTGYTAGDTLTIAPVFGAYNGFFINVLTVTAQPLPTFTASGNLEVTGTGGKVVITGKPYPYRAILESTAINPFRIKDIIMVVTNPAQIDNPIKYFKKNIFGSEIVNSINPRTFFNPNQFQSLLINVPFDLDIDDKTGIEYMINPGETVQLHLNVNPINKRNNLFN